MLPKQFPDRVISRHGDWEWLARSCDLTLCDLFLWVLLYGKFMGTNPKRFLSPELKEEIHQTLIDDIQPDKNFCEQVMRKTSKTAPYTYINDIEFYLLNTIMQ